MGVEIKVDHCLCTKCKKGVKSCTFCVLEWFEEQPITNSINCSACLECKSSCPVDAIDVEEKLGHNLRRSDKPICVT